MFCGSHGGKMLTKKYCLRNRSIFIAFFVGLLILFATLHERKLPSVQAQAADTPVVALEDCPTDAEWRWTSGPAQPDTARQAESDLSKENITSTIIATGFGEEDGCGNFKLYATDFAVEIKGNAILSSPEKQALGDKVLPVLSRYAKPKLGNVRIDFDSGGNTFYPGSPSTFNVPPISTAPLSNESVLNRKVYVLVYDPILKNGQQLSKYIGWYSYETLVQSIINFMQVASHGQVQYSVAYTSVVTNEWPVKIDGFRYTEETYLAMLQHQTQPHDPDTVNYDVIIDDPQFDLCGKLNRGEIDELWVYGFPWSGFYESRLVGPDAYWFNSPPVSGTHTCNSLLPIMGLNYERGLPEAIESFGHRTESTMTQTYGGWQENRTAHNWDRFGLVKAQSPNYSYSGCGSIHYSPNSTKDYEHDNPTPVLSNCDDFMNYPNLSDPLAVAQPVTCTAWNCNFIDYFMYWYGHFPSVSGCTAAIGNNWWEYFADPDLALNPSSSCPTVILTVNKSGTGDGTITSNPAGINCGSDCSEEYIESIQVELTASPDLGSGSNFAGWSGDADCLDGQVTMNISKTCTATFNSSLSANFVAGPVSGGAPLTVSLRIYNTSNITSCSWNFGDGTTGTSCAASQTHTFVNAGTFTVSLTVNGPGGSDTVSKSNYIYVLPLEYYPAAVIGNTGNGNGQLSYPTSIATDSLGNLYVIDRGNWRIEKFSTLGDYLLQWGSYGTGNGQFNDFGGMEVDDAGYVYVGDWYNCRIQKFTSNGVFVAKWGSCGSGPGQFHDGPGGIAADNYGYIYVTDDSNDRVQKFDKNGNFVLQWGSPGTGNGQFQSTEDVAIGQNDTVYVVDWANARIQMFNTSGGYLGQFGSYGSAIGQLNMPQTIDIDKDGNVYVGERGNCRVQKFTASGTPLTMWGGCGTDPGQFNYAPFGIALDGAGFIYASDYDNDRVQKFWKIGSPEPCFSLTISINDQSAGSVNTTPAPNCSDGIHYKYGTVVTLTAIASAGSTFTSWGGDADCMDGQVDMNADKSCTATFQILPPSPLTVTNTNDSGPGSLRHVMAGAKSGDRIDFAPTLAGKTIYLVSPLVISKNLTIDASTLSAHIHVDGQGSIRVFEVTSGTTVVLKNLVIANGFHLNTGGGLYNAGTVTIDTCEFISNKAHFGGGIYNLGTININHCKVQQNTAIATASGAPGLGGGALNYGVMNISAKSLFEQNSANPDSGSEYGGVGGGIMNFSSLDIDDSQFLSNRARDGAGINNNEGGNTHITNCIISNNSAVFGGGIVNFEILTIENSRITSNSSTRGGGGIDNNGILTLNDSLISGNTASGGAQPIQGGGIFNVGNMTASGTTFVNNSASLDGGAIYNMQNLTVINSTFLANSASGTGGGIGNGGTMVIKNSTFSENSAGSSPGGSGIYNAGVMNYTNNILANSTQRNDCYNIGTIGTNTSNLVESNAAAPNSCGTPSLSSDPQLAPLTDNGGPTQTMALLSDSPAINAGNDSACVTTDQRGVDRPQGSHCDIGAFEYSPDVQFFQVKIGNTEQGSDWLNSSQSRRKSYTGLNNGPVIVKSLNESLLIASQRVSYGGWSYSEMMGLPAEQLTKEYLFPYYNNVAMDSQLRVSNVGGVSTTIKVYLGSSSTPIDQYTLAAGGATRKNYSGKNSGPLRVTSSDSNILATIRVLYGGSSYSELMGLSVEQLAKEYIFPYYNNVAMDSQLRVSNVGGADTTITVYLGTQQIDQYTLAVGGATRKNYTGKNSGPLRVISSASNILTTIRVLYNKNSYSELMGFPTGQLGQEYWYPVYDNVAVNSQLRVSNVGSATTHITVYAGTEQIDSYDLGKGAATRKNYAKNTGPLHVVSSNQPILTTIRMLYAGNSYYEMTGLPDSQLSNQYFFPWYNNTAMSSELRIAVP
jgi:PKD repeat protein